MSEENNWWEYGRYFSSNTSWLDGPVIYARDLGAEENARLLARYPDFAAYRVSGDELTPLAVSQKCDAQTCLICLEW